MGRLQAEEMRAWGSDEQALTWHLQSNHYPPVRLDLLPVAKKAIANAKKGLWDKLVKFPKGYPRSSVPTREIIEALHLDTWLD